MYNSKYIREDDAYGIRPLFLGTSLRLKNPPFKHHLYKHQKKKVILGPSQINVPYFLYSNGPILQTPTAAKTKTKCYLKEFKSFIQLFISMCSS